VSLYRRGEWWWIDISSESGRVREPAKTTDRKEAQEYHAKRENEIWRQVKLGESPPVTWGEAVKKWLDERPRSLPERYLIARFGFSLTSELPLSESSVTKAIKGNSTAVSAGSWNRCLSLITAIHNCSKVSPPSIQRKRTPPGRLRWLSAEEWERLKSALQEESPTLADLAEFSVHTGLRENNALELRWDQVDLKRRVAWFYADQMKGKVPHGIPLNDAALAVLERRRRIHKVYVFPAPDSGKPYTKASNRAWYAALRKSKLNGVVWHTLRHTWASWAVMSGVRLEELMRLGGWKTYSMVLRYAHLAPEHLSEAASKVHPVSRK
jgi:integrase